MIVELEKVAIKLGKKSTIAEGHRVIGNRCLYFKVVEGSDNDLNAKIEDATPSDIAIGGQLLVMRGMYDFIRTSPITEVIERTQEYITFGTNSSVYTLKIIDK